MSETQRLDKWLWFARFLKSRSLATTLANSGKLRLNGQLIMKAHQQVKAGDVLTFPLGHHIRVIKVLQTGIRRGPASEAQTLYEDLSPPLPHQGKETASQHDVIAQRDAGSGRPTKRERRAIDQLRDRDRTDS